MLKTWLRATAFAGALLLPGVAVAVPAMVTTDLNYRGGPGVQHQRLGTIPAGRTVDVRGCIQGFGWCRIYWAGRTGWVSGTYLAYLERGYRRAPLPSVDLAIGVPIITFGIDRWDRDRWYHHRRVPRAYWHGRAPKWHKTAPSGYQGPWQRNGP